MAGSHSHDATDIPISRSGGVEQLGPTRPNDVRVELRGVEPVDPSSRFGHPSRLFTLWFSGQLSPSTLFVGVLGTALGLGWQLGVVAIVIGNLLGSITVAMLAVIGTRTGVPQLQQSRMAFGRLIQFPAGLTWLTQIGFEALAAVFGAEALTVIFGINYYVGLAITFGLMAVLSIVGYELIHIFEKVMAVVLLVLFAIITIRTFDDHPHVTSHLSGGPLVGMFLLMIAIVFGYAISWGLNAADLARYLPEDTPAYQTFTAVYGGLCAGMIWIEILGFAASALFAGLSSMAGVYKVVGGGALGQVAMVGMFLGTLAILAIEDYGAALQAQALGVRLLRPFLTVASAGVAFAVASWLNTGSLYVKFENVLLLITYWTASWTAIVLINWVMEGRRMDTESRYTLFSSPISRLLLTKENIWAAIALVVGFIACLPFSDTTTGLSIDNATPGLKWLFGGVSNHFLYGGDLAFYVAFIVSAAVYLGAVVVLRSRQAAPAAMGVSPALAVAGPDTAASDSAAAAVDSDRQD
jgi:nucleobase:cation symporter-1, NCS1 family